MQLKKATVKAKCFAKDFFRWVIRPHFAARRDSTPSRSLESTKSPEKSRPKTRCSLERVPHGRFDP